MTSHIEHPDDGDMRLVDGCPRCGEHALHPFDSLDDSMLSALLYRVEKQMASRTTNEALAMNAIRHARWSCDKLVDLGYKPR